MKIGDWVKRQGAFRRHVSDDGTERWTGPRWHLVESVVAEDAVTRCGRRMDRITRSGGELQVSLVMPLTRAIGQPQLCKAGCEREFQPTFPGVTWVEDDGSTQPETVP